MTDAIEYNAIVWRKHSNQPPERLRIQALDEAAARRLLVERFGNDIVCSVWTDADALADPVPGPAERTGAREYQAIVWTGPDVPGQRVRVDALTVHEATRLLKERFGDAAVCSIWNEEDADRTR